MDLSLTLRTRKIFFLVFCNFLFFLQIPQIFLSLICYHYLILHANSIFAHMRWFFPPLPISKFLQLMATTIIFWEKVELVQDPLLIMLIISNHAFANIHHN